MRQVVKLSSSSLAESNNVFVKTKSKEQNYISLTTAKEKNAVFRVSCDPFLESNDVIALNTYQRQDLSVEIGEEVSCNFINDPLQPISSVTFVISHISSKKAKPFEVDEEFVKSVKFWFTDLPIAFKQTLVFKNTIFFICNDLLPNAALGVFTEKTELNFISADINITLESTSASAGPLFKGNFNFLELGIGGLDKQFEIVFRRAFASRLLPPKIVENLGINHIRGILLYGPPGCGKTLIARQIGKILNCEEPKIVNGPELFSGLVGSSEQNVRKLFEDAIADKSGKKLHLVICDEFDSVAKQRGSIRGDAGSNDKVVNQFLTMIDGPKSLNNVLLICMTNRKDLIDEALLRPGRLELHIEVNLPDEKGRLDILKIHTNKMNQAKYLDSCVDLQELATKTINYTGAELESIVRNAASYSISRHIDPENLSNAKKIVPILNQGDFFRAISEVKPQFGLYSSVISDICAKPFQLYSPVYADTYSAIKEKLFALEKGNNVSFMLMGARFTGKTTMAAHIAKECGYSCVRFINSEEMFKKQPRAENFIFDTFTAGTSLDSFLIILDSVENLVEYTKIGNHINNHVLQIMYTILDKVVANRTAIMFTSANPALMESIELVQKCSFTYKFDDIFFPNTMIPISKYFQSQKFNSLNNS